MWLWFEKNYFIKSTFSEFGLKKYMFGQNCGWNWGWTKSGLKCLVKNVFQIEVIITNIYIYIYILMIFNLNIIDLTTAITSWNK